MRSTYKKYDDNKQYIMKTCLNRIDQTINKVNRSIVKKINKICSLLNKIYFEKYQKIVYDTEKNLQWLMFKQSRKYPK